MITTSDFFPFLRWLPNVSGESLRADSVAALTAAVVVLPQGIAFAAIAGLPPEYGFYTAIIIPVIAALFGSSYHLISGPTTAISVLVFAALASSYEPGSTAFIQAAILLTLLAGLFQFILGLLRFGVLANFVSPSVMMGFTAGAALVIALSQLDSALGVVLPRPENFVSYAPALISSLDNINPISLTLAMVTLVSAVLIKALLPRWPNYLLALIIGSSLAFLLNASDQGVPHVGALPNILPSFAVPEMSFSAIRDLSQAALAIALVGLLEAVAIGRAIAARSGQDFDANQEFIGQGLSNVIGGFFSAYVGSGSFTRTGVNYESGARTPMAAILSSVFLLIILLFISDLVSFIPIPAVAGVILVVAYKLIAFTEIKEILKSSRLESIVIMVTFASTLLIGLEFAIYAGVLTSLIIFLKRTANPYLAMTAPDPDTGGRNFRNAPAFGLDECPQFGIARLDGQLFFGSLEGLRKRLRNIKAQRPEMKHMLMLLKGVNEIDLAGAQLLMDEHLRFKNNQGELYITARQRQISEPLTQYHVIDSIGKDKVYSNKGDAIKEIVPKLDQAICRTCTKRIFNECPPSES